MTLKVGERHLQAVTKLVQDVRVRGAEHVAVSGVQLEPFFKAQSNRAHAFRVDRAGASLERVRLAAGMDVSRRAIRKRRVLKRRHLGAQGSESFRRLLAKDGGEFGQQLGVEVFVHTGRLQRVDFGKITVGGARLCDYRARRGPTVKHDFKPAPRRRLSGGRKGGGSWQGF